MNLMQWGTQHFVRIYRTAVIRAAGEIGKTVNDFFWMNPDVVLLTRYLAQLGYEWGFRMDQDHLSYWFYLKKNGEELYTDMFSSGEREIVHFLLAMFALNVQDGLILVDEPELHLHPRWQRIFLGLFRDLAPEKNNQFVITTHAPAFVTPETIDSVTRVYRSDRGSAQVALRDVHLPAKKSLVRMINSQNNERLFFADKVVLVEGISDRLVIESLLDTAAIRFNITSAIEVVEVGGKHNFSDYRDVLKGLLTPVYTVADRDYLTIVGEEEVRALFITDVRKQWSTLTEDKKSMDGSAMISHLDMAIATANFDDLRKFWDYFSNRHKRFKNPLTELEQRQLEAEIIRLGSEGTFVLREGEIEDYLPPGVRDVRGIIELVSDGGWINKILNSELRVELGNIVCEILGVMGDSRKTYLHDLRQGGV